MKKLLSIAAVAALLSTATMAVPNQIGVGGNVLAGAQVSMGAAPTGTLTAGTFMFEGGTIAFNNMPLGAPSVNTQGIYVNTNSATGITMAISDPVNGGNMVNGGNTVPTSYSLLGNPVAIGGGAIDLVLAPNPGNISVGNLVTTATPSANQVSGNYNATLNVTIAQK